MVSIAGRRFLIPCSLAHRTRIRIGRICGRKPFAIFRFASTPRARLLLPAREIFTKFGGNPQPALLFGRTELRFSTVRDRAFRRIRNVRGRSRSLVFQWVCHGLLDSPKPLDAKGPGESLRKLQNNSLSGLHCRKVYGNRPLVPGDTTLRPPDAAIAQG